MNYRAPVFLFLLSVALCASGQRFPSDPHVALGVSNSASLAGIVRTYDGKPLRNARIEVRQPSSGQVVAATYTLPNGTFEISNLNNGHYEVVATQGVDEVREQVDIFGLGANLAMRMSVESAPAGQHTVSVAQMKVPEKARNLYRKAQGHADKNKLADAAKEVAKALEIAPQYAPALTLRALLAMQDGKPALALPDLEAATTYDPSYGLGFIVLGSAYNMVGRFDDAIRVLSRAQALAPAAWQLHFEMSKALLGKGDYAKSLQQASKAGELAASDYPPLHLVMAHAYLGLKDYSQAITHLEQFITRDPSGADSVHARQTLDQARAFAAK